ncbi:MAG: hypothetical protein P8Y70_06540 [Candidatus Lokiarchaeota archaeon]
MVLGILDYLNGVMSSIFVISSVAVGLIIAFRYTKIKDFNLILLGISWIILCEPWIAQSVSFISYFTFGNGLSIIPHLVIGYFFLPFGVILWIIVITNLIYKSRQKLILFIFICIEIVFMIVFFCFLFIRPAILGSISGAFDIDYGPLLLIYILPHLIIVLVTGILFARESLKSEKRDIQLKGKFLIIAFISYLIGGMLSVFSNYSPILLIIGRLITISSAFEFYLGFILPTKVKMIFIK